MDYEKKYNEALERARQIKDGKDEWRYSDLAEIIPALTYIFPQLRESEDETTRKELLDFVRSFWADRKEKLPQASRWVTYLEKQKEIPMPDSTTLLKMWDDEEKMLREKGIDDMWRLAYNAFLDGFAQGMMVKQKERKSISQEDFDTAKHEALWEEQKPKNILTDKDTIQTAYCKGQTDVIEDPEAYGLCKKPEWSEEDENYLGVIVRLVEQVSGWPERAITEYTNWLKSLRPQPKPSWSEEDKAIVGCIAVCLDGQFVTEAARKQCLEWFNKHRRDFLNSPSWKPSEEHLSALLAVFNDPDNIGSQTCQLALTDLYEHLKKL